VENLFGGRIGLVGSMLIITSLMLLFANYAKNMKKDISFPKAFIIGIAQAFAVVPGISRSGATISTSLLMGVDKEKATRFSFIMVLIPIIGAMLLDVIIMIRQPELSRGISIPVLMIGFLAAFLTGIFACRWMIAIVKKGKLLYFAIYCFIIGLTAIGFSIFYVN
jgi:undecaprenyl-diphosphatase